MRSHAGFRVLVLGFAVLASSFASCSNSGAAEVFADLRWRVRCETMRMCSGYPDRCILGFDGDTVEDCGTTIDQRVSCNVIETATTRTLTFNTSATTPGASYALGITAAAIPRAGGSAGGTGCQVTVREDATTFTGACGASPPNEAQPCQVSNVRFMVDAEGRTLITGNLYCVNISPAAAMTIDREVTAPGNEPAATTQPMTFSLYDCRGYTPD